MSEMLGNQYFLARKFSEAQLTFEGLIRRGLSNISIKKKLVICYTQTHCYEKALIILNEVIDEDFDSIIDSDPILDDCPCPDLIYELESSGQFVGEYHKPVVMGIFWLYCDLANSIQYFQKASKLPHKFDLVETTLNKLLSIQHKLKYEAN